MFMSRIYYTIEVFLAFGILLQFTDAKSIAQQAEKKDIQKPVDRLNHDNANDKFHNNFQKRQIAPEFTQLGQSLEPQYFQQQPFLPGSQNSFPDGQFFNQFPNPASADEEERFFLSQQTTTLNPLSFGNPPPASTQDPVQQQQAEEQRRFQQEIADQGLREQQQKSFGVPRPVTTTPPPAPQPAVNPLFQQFDPQGQFVFGDPSAQNPSAAQLPQDSLPFGADFNQQAYFPTVRELRSISEKSPRSIDRQLGSHNDLGFFSSTVSPSPLLDNLIQHSTPKEDLTQIGNWLIDNLTKQIQRHLTGYTKGASKRHQHSTPRPTAHPALHYSTTTPFQQPAKSLFDFDLAYSTQPPNQHSTKSPVDFERPYYTHTTTTKLPPSFEFQHSTEGPVPAPVYQSTPIYQSTTNNVVDLSSYPNWNNIRGLNIPTSTPSYIAGFEPKQTAGIDHYENFEPKRIKNVQILPFSTDLPNYQTTVKPYDNNVYQAYKQVYDIDQQVTRQQVTSTPSFLQIIDNRPSTDGMSVATLFRSKLNELKENEKSSRRAIPQIKILERGYSEFEQHDKFFDQLLQNNTYNDNNNYSESTTASYDPSSTAIFVKVPEEPPTSTVGFLFDKTITKNIHKKENSHPKHKNNSNRSPQIIKSSLVYRTPPGKRATVSRSEISRSNQVDSGLLTNLLLGDSSKSLKWLLGNDVPTTTSRPFVTALLNFIQKRATPANDSDDA